MQQAYIIKTKLIGGKELSPVQIDEVYTDYSKARRAVQKIVISKNAQMREKNSLSTNNEDSSRALLKEISPDLWANDSLLVFIETSCIEGISNKGKQDNMKKTENKSPVLSLRRIFR